MSNVVNGPAPSTGDIVSIDLSGHRETVVSGLDFPTGMTFGRDGNLYISNKGFGFGPKDGEILNGGTALAKKQGRFWGSRNGPCWRNPPGRRETRLH